MWSSVWLSDASDAGASASSSSSSSGGRGRGRGGGRGRGRGSGPGGGRDSQLEEEDEVDLPEEQEEEDSDAGGGEGSSDDEADLDQTPDDAEEQKLVRIPDCDDIYRGQFQAVWVGERIKLLRVVGLFYKHDADVNDGCCWIYGRLYKPAKAGDMTSCYKPSRKLEQCWWADSVAEFDKLDNKRIPVKVLSQIQSSVEKLRWACVVIARLVF